MTNAARKPQAGTELADPRLAEINAHLSHRMRRQFVTRRGEAELDFNTEVQYAFAALQANDFAMSYALKNPESVGIALLDLADVGLSLAPSKRHAYLIPQKVGGKEAIHGKPSYLGFEYKALKSGAVTLIQSNIVMSRDTFRKWTDETGSHLLHEEARGNRGTFELVYTMAKYAGGEVHIETMTEADLDSCWKAAVRANNGSPPMIGKDWLDEWRKKCCVRRASKHWPSTPALAKLREMMDRLDPMDFGDREERSTDVAQEPCLTKDQIDELAAMIPGDTKRKESWLLNFAQVLGHNNIGDVPISKFENLKERVAKRVEATSKAT